VAPIPDSGDATNWMNLANASASDQLPWSLKNIPWSPRSGHSVSLEPASPRNLQTRALHLVGGTTGRNGDGTGRAKPEDALFLDDVWSWQLDQPNETWRKDYTTDELFLTDTPIGFEYRNNSPTVQYVSPDSDLRLLKRWWTPDRVKKSHTLRLEERDYITDRKLQMLNQLGLYTIRDLAEADKYTILKLRGFDFPQVKS
jgi:hypothetical protein